MVSIEEQMACFNKGVCGVTLDRPALIGDGIIKLSENEEKIFLERFLNLSGNFSFCKFVPASGAATRMFRDIYQSIGGKTKKTASILYENRKLLPFKLETETEQEFFSKLVDKETGFGKKPKALIPFHSYDDNSLTAFEEQIQEGLDWFNHVNTHPDFHFTISEEYESEFDGLTNGNVNVGFSFQNSDTDTIAVDMKNEPVYDADEEHLKRPGGHGSLILNLSKLSSDVIFIKNIDNILPEYKRNISTNFKRISSGLFLHLKSEIDRYVSILDHPNIQPSESELLEMSNFYTKYFPSSYVGSKDSNKVFDIKTLLSILDRPFRVVSMVKNTGEPGGGPFWVEDEFGKCSLQIVESSQIDMDDSHQKNVVQESSHFNPVDLICSFKRYDGSFYDLKQYIDSNTYFISEKSHEGKTIKALEHPGLWNGAMAHWNTVFIDAPLETFAPVKTINDLLKPEHQP